MKAIIFKYVGELLIAIVVMVLLIGMFSCRQSDIDANFKNAGFQVILIDSCEYLYKENVNAVVIAHKANCKNHKK